MGNTEINTFRADKCKFMHNGSEKESVWKALGWLGLYSWIWRDCEEV